MANSDRNDMLFSSSDSPQPAAILSGEGLGEEIRRIAVIEELVTCGLQQMNQLQSANFLLFTLSDVVTHTGSL
jgi:hypothetical protein